MSLYYLSQITITNGENFFTADENGTGTLQKSKAPSNGNTWENKYLVRALYSYLSNGENQLSFLKGDFISVIGECENWYQVKHVDTLKISWANCEYHCCHVVKGERNKGWQYGENLRTKFSGWFPTAYTEQMADDETNS